MVKDNKSMLSAIVGAGNVLDEYDILAEYSRDHSFARPTKPSLVVRPRNTDEVQEVVKWANETSVPLVPVSSGPPHFNGDTVPSVDGAVIIDLSGLKQIRRIDRRNRMALIEPGVTYSELQPELAKHGLRLSAPFLPRSNKSVLASLLERQPITNPKYQWALPEPLRCLGIVWGNGETLWTGDAGSQVHSLEQQWEIGFFQVDPKGPQETDWYRLVSAGQGSMGIVTWASVKCEVLPQVQKPLFLPANDLNSLIDCAYRLLRLRLGDEFLLLNSAYLARIIQQEPGQLPQWTIILGVAGRDIFPEQAVEVQEKDIADTAGEFGLQFMSDIPGMDNQRALQMLSGPSREPYWKLTCKGSCQDIFFLTTLNKISQFIETVHSLAEAAAYPLSDIGIYIQPQHQGVACHCEFNLPYDPANSNEVDKVNKLYARCSEELINQGAYFSRPYGIWASMVYARDDQSTNLLRGLKGIFDPNHVLNPGKLCF